MIPRALLCLSALLVSASAWAIEPDQNEDGWFDATVEEEAPEASPAPEQGVDLSEDGDPRALTEFRQTLDPYGEWQQHPRYGLVWVPSRGVVGDGFVPYVSSGRWAVDATGEWVWQSDHPFGWVVFHYGRWVFVPQTGWAWVPGYRYAPAWVVWGSVSASNLAYVGWAPMGPSFVWVNGVAIVVVDYWTPHWVYCRSHYFGSPGLHRHVVRNRTRRRLLERRTVTTERPPPALRSKGASRPVGGGYSPPPRAPEFLPAGSNSPRAEPSERSRSTATPPRVHWAPRTDSAPSAPVEPVRTPAPSRSHPPPDRPAADNVTVDRPTSVRLRPRQLEPRQVERTAPRSTPPPKVRQQRLVPRLLPRKVPRSQRPER